MKGIGKILINVGWLFIILGIIGGLVAYSDIDKDSYEIAKKVADELFTNEIAQSQYQAARTLYISEITYAISILFGGITSGLLFQGIGRIIQLLEKIVNQNTEKEKRSQNNSITKNEFDSGVNI